MIKNHIENTLKINTAPTPLPRMILCSLSTTLPLILGYNQSELPIAMFGALFGFVLILNDFFGPIKQRLSHLLVTFVFLILGFFAGAYLSDKFYLLLIVLFLASFLLGKVKSQGVELERMLLFTTLQLLTAGGSIGIKNIYKGLIYYSALSFLNYIFCLLLIYFFSNQIKEFMSSKRETLKKVFATESSYRFAFIFATTATLGFFIATKLEVSKPFWVVGTTLIVMLPDTHQSFYKSIQRLLGTLVGLIIATFLLNFIRDPRILIGLISVFSFFAPLGLTKNYWIGNIFIAVLIHFFLEIPRLEFLTMHDTYQLALIRVQDIGLGCLLGIIATLINNPKILIRKISI